MNEANNSPLINSRARPLPVALADQLASMPADDARAATLRRLYAALPQPDQERCRAELARHSAGPALGLL